MPIELAVFGNVAVMSGRVPSAGYRERVRELIENESGVERVVDKLHVQSRRRR
jgi:osmotically-inducible protein OsmY